MALAVVALAAGCGGATDRRYDLLPVDGAWRDDPTGAAADGASTDASLPAPARFEATRVDGGHVVVHVTQDVLDWFVQVRTDGAGRWRATWVASCSAPPSGNAPDPTPADAGQ